MCSVLCYEFIHFLKHRFIYSVSFGSCWVFVAVWAFPTCGERGLLIVGAAVVVEHRRESAGTSVVAVPGL